MAEPTAPEDHDDDTIRDEDGPARRVGAAPTRGGWRKALVLALKVGISAGGLLYVWSLILRKDGVEELFASIGNLHWGWIGMAILMQLLAIACAVGRWRLLLGGQGIRAGLGFLFPSFLIGRFWGALTPGGLGLDGWRLYDVGSKTGKWARATAVTAVEKVLGQIAMFLVVMGASVWGVAFLGTSGILLVNAVFVVVVSLGILFLSRPELFLWAFRLAPRQLRPRLQALIDAVGAYRGRAPLLIQGALLGVGVHSFNNLIYVCAAQAIGVELSPGLVFFASSLQIMATLVPGSINGIGLREVTAVALYAQVGLSEAQAVLIPVVGFALAEMVVSAFGVVPLLARRYGYRPTSLVVEDADREDRVLARWPEVPRERWPSVVRGTALGAGGGLLGGMLVGIGEAAVVVADTGARTGYGVLAYAAVAYGLFCALGAAVGGLLGAWSGRLMKREAVPEAQAFAQWAGLVVAAFAFALGAFRIRRDVFSEAFGWKSPEGLALLGACAAAALVLFLAVSWALRAWAGQRSGAFLLRAWGAPLVAGGVVGALLAFTVLVGPRRARVVDRPAADPDAPSVLVVVVDTLRADHLPLYGYEPGSTPRLDAFAEDAVVYERAYANASWTRPSFASILTGHYARSHRVMGKSDRLSPDLVTLPEALRAHGYATGGVVTNPNVSAFYGFDQGFDAYTYLEPEFILGADDTAAKLLLVQALRRPIEGAMARFGSVRPGTAYRDAEEVNRALLAWLDGGRPAERPFFAFVGYMDPHDPYFAHPYDGEGYAKVAHPHPSLEEADHLRDLYDGEITFWDEHFGALLDALRERGLYDDLMIVVTSDHGEEFADHGGFWHGETLYDEQLHVPLLIKLPGNARAGTSVRHWVQSIDLMPTVLARAGVREVPAGIQGQTVSEPTERAYAEETHNGAILESVRQLRDFRELKLITANAGNPRGLAPVELYDVGEDPGEQRNLAPDAPEVDALTAGLDEARSRAVEGAVEAVHVELGEDQLRQNCRIGYIEKAECCERGLLPADQCTAID
ncbi:MAG: sulfatase-like hydrolase/transferase [Sandaracinaceae bacterium]